MLGAQHPRTLGITGNLVMTLVQSGRFAEAEALLAPYELALARRYPDTHPDRFAALVCGGTTWVERKCVHLAILLDGFGGRIPKKAALGPRGDDRGAWVDR